MSISQRLYLVLGIMVLLISAELTALVFTIHTLSAVRAYVGGEGLWSKAQKDAVYHLEAYGRTRDPKEYAAYRSLLGVSLGDRAARLEMSKPNPDWNKEYQGFLRGGNNPSDIPGMIALFQRFNRISYISDAIADWTEGDSLLSQIQGLATQLHAQITSGQPPRTAAKTLAQIGDVNASLTVVEDRFSSTLGDGSRWMTGLILTILFAAALTVELSGLLLTASVTRRISVRLKAMLRAADQIARGDYRIDLDTQAPDELGRLASAFTDMAHDIETEQRRAAHAAKTAEAALREAQRVAHIGSLDWDIRRDVFTCSKELRRLLEMQPTMATSTFTTFIAGIYAEDRQNVAAVLRSACALREPFSVDFRVAMPGGAVRWLCAQGTVEEDSTGDPVRLMGTALDITERKRSQDRLEYLAQHDSLTGLPNRMLLFDRLRQAIALARRADCSGALLFLDLDNFKELNDTLGHAAGDRLLVLVGERLRAGVREIDTVARSGGDEFLIVLNSLASPEACRLVGNAVLRAFSDPFTLDGNDIRVTASVGMAIFPQDGDDAEALVRQADLVMYKSKRRGTRQHEAQLGSA
ncbi:MAG TPA: diguanylate cyclase [Candidatus Eremiobacteraceae bacterium]|nr:diguanylate cyclase [Candidatus Eremiobacteraceae bacterium]